MVRVIIAAVVMLLSVGASESFSRLMIDESLSLEDVKDKIVRMTPPEAGIPESEPLMLEEIRRIDNERDAMRMYSRQGSDLAKVISNIDPLQNKLTFIRDAWKKCDCSTQSGDEVEKLYRDSTTLARDVRGLTMDIDVVLDNQLQFPVAGTSSSLKKCEVYKEYFSRLGDDAIKGSFDSIRKGLEAELSRMSELKKEVAKYKELLDRRYSIIRTKMDSRSTQQQLSGSLWFIILIIGLLSIGAIVVVKMFDDNIQLEWVVSGQVIQFVTVMVLLSVVMALGLAGILKENTLGTLLGGIAGYVLAQGVGRAAARDVQRNRASMGGRCDDQSSGG